MITNKETESIIQKTPNKQKSRTRWLRGWVLLFTFQTFWKICIEKNASEFILKASITMIQKLDKTPQERENERTIPLMNTDVKTLNEILANWI